MEIKMQVKKILIGILLFLLLLITVQNLTVVEVKFLFWKLGINLLLVILLAFLIGNSVGWLLKSLYSRQKTAKPDQNLNKT